MYETSANCEETSREQELLAQMGEVKSCRNPTNNSSDSFLGVVQDKFLQGDGDASNLKLSQIKHFP